MELDIKDIAMMLGEKDLIIFQLNKTIEGLQKQISDMTKQLPPNYRGAELQAFPQEVEK